MSEPIPYQLEQLRKRLTALEQAAHAVSPATVGPIVRQIVESSIANIGAAAPVRNANNIISLAYSQNLKTTAQQLDTIQDIKTTDSPAFAGVTLPLGDIQTQLNAKSACYSVPFTSQTSITVTHNLGHDPIVQVKVGGAKYDPEDITFDTVDAFTVTFSSAQSGTIIYIG